MHPLHAYARWTTVSALKICVIIVLASIALSLPRTILGGMLHLTEGMPWDPRIPSDNSTAFERIPVLFCFEDLGPDPRHIFVSVYNSIRILVFYIIPLVVNFWMCSRINKALSDSNKRASDFRDEQAKRETKHRKLVRMVRWMVIVFAVCWFPYQGFLLVQALDSALIFQQEWFQKIMILVSVFMYFHCISNPILYYLMNSQFRKGKHINTST